MNRGMSESQIPAYDMKVKIFTGDSPKEIEEQVNNWLHNQPDNPDNIVICNMSYSHCPGVYESPNTIGYSFSMAIIFGKAI